MHISEALDAVLSEAQERGLLGAAPLQQHVDHAAAFVDAAGEDRVAGSRLLDLGSGGGIPGLVVAARCPTTKVTLLDGRAQRVEFLERAVEQLTWSDRVEVVGARAEVAGRSTSLRGTFDVVVARGFARPAVTAECAAPLLRMGGVLVVSEPPGATDAEPRWPADGCALLGLALESVVALPWSFAVLRQEQVCPDRYPRRVGIPEKRPLF